MTRKREPHSSTAWDALLDAIENCRDVDRLVMEVSADRRALDQLKAAWRHLEETPQGATDLAAACASRHLPVAFAESRIRLLAHLLRLAPDTEDYYAVLGVSPESSAEEIQHAFRQLCKMWHPDRNPHQSEAVETFLQIQAAYQVLGNPERRREYDRHRQMLALCPTDPLTKTTATPKKRLDVRSFRGAWPWVTVVAVVLAMVYVTDFQGYLSRRYFAAKAPSLSGKPSPNPPHSKPNSPKDTASSVQPMQKETPSHGATDREKAVTEPSPPMHSLSLEREEKMPGRPEPSPAMPGRALTEKPSPLAQNIPSPMPNDQGPPASLHGSTAKSPSTTAPETASTPKTSAPPPEGRVSVAKGTSGDVKTSSPKTTAAAAVQEAPKAQEKKAAEKPKADSTTVVAKSEPGKGPQAAVPEPSKAQEKKAAEKPKADSTMVAAKSEPGKGPQAAVQEPQRVNGDRDDESPQVLPPPMPMVRHTEAGIVSFLESYCRTFTEKRLEAFLAFFTADALENGRPVRALRAQYEKNFSETQKLLYHIRLEKWKVVGENLEITGRFDLGATFPDGSGVRSRGVVSMVLVPKSDSYCVKRYDYRFVESERRPSGSGASM